MLYFRKTIIPFLFLSILFNYKSLAQFYSTGQDPSSVKWNQINTDNFQIIFQKEFEDQAQKIANTLDYYYQQAGESLNHSPKKISVIVHNQTILSNGYVAWAPKRMELFATPPQDISPDPWLEHLCIHELRHVVQIDKLNQGITKILAIVFGQQAIGLIAGQLPMWYYEGDAVCTETSYSEYGRGRLPYFERGIKTHLLSDEKRYSFDQSLFGSYTSYIPNHYEFGYQLTAYTRAKYGKNIWNDIENHVARNSYTLLPTYFSFYRGLKKNIGLSQRQLYNQALNHLDSSWSYKQQSKDFTKPKFFQTYEIDEYEDYINPVVIDENKIIALKKGYSHIPQFVLVNPDSEKIIYEPGYLISNDFSYADNILVWAEYRPDRRWQNREYTSMKLFNIITQTEKVIVEESRYFSPDFSPNAQKIVVVNVDESNNSSIVILKSFDGSVLTKIESNGGNFIQRPKWSEDEQYIYVIELTNSGKQVSRYNLKENRWEVVFKLKNADIQRIQPTNNYVFFHSTFNGTDNIYVFDLKSGEIYQISESKFGISEFDLSANEHELITNEYTSQGFRLATIPIERALWKRININNKYKFEFAEVLTDQELKSDSLKTYTEKEFSVKSYRKYLNQFNFHSWLPFFIDYEQMNLGNAFADPSEIYDNVHPGVTFLSQNKLSATDAILGYAYKNGNHFLSSTVIFEGKYPVFQISANYGTEQLIRTTSDVTWYPQTNMGYSYDLDIYIPFNFTKGKFIKGFRPLISIEYFDNYYYNYQNDYYIRGLEILQTNLLFYSYQSKAKKDIIPELGAIFEFRFKNTPFESEIFGYLCNADALFYLPGIGNSGFKTNFGYQYQKPDLYLFNSNFDFPRGIVNKRTERMVKLYSDYVFPIAYPDWNLGSALYIQRLRGDLFIDYAYNTYKVYQSQTVYNWSIEHNYSFGLELTADYHLLRTIFPLSTGVRIGYASTGSIFVEMMFGIDLYSF
ncbi:hypothetical protein ACFLS4_00420 [Bacteroidota bacterium]